MNRFAVYNFTVAVIVACFIWTPAFAQSEKISLRMVPQPNQVLRIRMVQETDADMSFDGNSSVPGANAAEFVRPPVLPQSSGFGRYFPVERVW